MTMTRTELLRSRGYDESIIAGSSGTNGHTPVVKAPVSETNEPSNARTGPVCSECGTRPARANSPTCSDTSCQRAYRQVRRKAADARRGAIARSPSGDNTPPAPPEQPNEVSRIRETVETLTSAGLQLVVKIGNVELTVRAG